jgi:hypothetical protein
LPTPNGLFHISDLACVAFVVDDRLRVQHLNAAAATALGIDEGAGLSTAAAPFDGMLRVRDGKVVLDPERVRDPFGRDLHAVATTLTEGTTLVLVHDISTAVERAMRDLAGGFVHELRNVGFGLLVMADMLGDNLANQEALRHTRASIARLTAATDVLQYLARALDEPLEEFDIASIVDAASERIWTGSTRHLAHTGARPCLAWGHPELLVATVGVVLEEVAAHAPKTNVIAAHIQRIEDQGPSSIAITIRALDDASTRERAKIAWETLVVRREGRLTVGLGLARRWVRAQGGRLTTREASNGNLEMTIVIPVDRRA